MKTELPRPNASTFVGSDRVLFGIIFGVLALWLFAQTTLNISPVMAEDLEIGRQRHPARVHACD